MMRFLRKGDCYALEKPIKKRYYLSLNSFQCLLLSLSTIYYQFSCNVQKSRARGTTDEGGRGKKPAVMKPSWSMANVMSFNTLLIHCYYFTHTWRILRPYTKTASAKVAGVFGVASRLGRTLVHICSTGVRLLFECCSGAVRVRLEAQSKDCRRAPEGLSNKCRSRLEAQSKASRRALEGLSNNSRSRVEGRANIPPRFACHDGKMMNDLYMNRLISRRFESFCKGVRGEVESMLVKNKRSSQNGLNEAGSFLFDKESVQRAECSLKFLVSRLNLKIGTKLSQFKFSIFGTSGKKRANDIKKPLVYGLQLIAIFCVLFNFASIVEAKAQELRQGGATGIGEIKPLEIGDTVPNVSLKILNSDRKIVQDRLRNYGGKKWIILEFWNTICGPCIAAMPHLFEIQAQLKERIEVLPVTWEASERINLFFENIKNTPLVALQHKFRTAVEDSLLRKLFGQFSYPHTVILDEKRIVRLITKPQYLTTASLSELMDGKSNPIKNQLISLDGDPLFKTNPIIKNEPKLVFYSGITSFVQGLTTDYIFKLDSTAGTVHELIPNRSILNLYNSARLTDGSYPKGLSLRPQSRLLLVEEPHKFAYIPKKQLDLESKLAWDQENCYNYELCLPYDLGDSEYRRKRLGQDLDSFFGLKSSVTTATVPCLVICQSKEAETLSPKDTSKSKLLVINGLVPSRLKERELVIGPAESGALNYIRGLDFKELCVALQKLSNATLPVIITDLPTDVHFNIDFVSSSNSLGMLKKALENSGYKLVEGKAEVELFVIRDQNRKESFDDLVFTPLGYLTREDWLNNFSDSTN
ncbi:redoxin domain-containing protein [Sphingobacterium sp. UT-1RO-CII-1]|uniref:TlpA family protein disulfide reductase n=1 Tax=Sphingobacterium sp. UT-1RO-CII-1 TaxID=2995225 RepID=UPI00227ADDE3|nr:redoxin domain-containing protein [Sphingobacterium sp. UT-1RO-CII-1]MCY4780020.1 redoxin domain-containing protein [Sphingobacterium sp. UT-1RO-CII-1]